MSLNGLNIGIGICGSFCTFETILPVIDDLVKGGANVYPVLSYNSLTTDTRFGNAKDFIRRIVDLTNNEVIDSITKAETVGPKGLFDIMAIAPCTGNSLAKLTNGITDTPVLMAAKGHLRNDRPLVIAVSTNDGLGFNFKNIGILMNSKNIYFVPFNQDNCVAKPKSLVAHMNLLTPTILTAMDGKQYQPVIS